MRTFPTDGKVFIVDNMVGRMMSSNSRGPNSDSVRVRPDEGDMTMVMSFCHVILSCMSQLSQWDVRCQMSGMKIGGRAEVKPSRRVRDRPYGVRQ